MRVVSANPSRKGGWVHYVAERRTYEAREEKPAGPFNTQALVGFTSNEVDDLADSLGLPLAALTAFGCVYNPKALIPTFGGGLIRCATYAWPMYDHKDQLIGLRLRDGERKRAWPGSHSGLFIARPQQASRVLWVDEGPTSAGALYAAGFRSVGVPCCYGYADMLLAYVAKHSVDTVVLVYNSDCPGDDGVGAGERGTRLASTVLTDHGYAAKIINVSPHKDSREAYLSGWTKEDFESRLDL
jgi:hypothetical protein